MSMFLVICLVPLLSTFIVEGTCPNIISRNEWGARPGTRARSMSVNPLPYVIIHHSAGVSCYTKETCSRAVKSYQDDHIIGKDWGDIGYSFLIGEDGNVYEGRGWDKAGSHAKIYNRKSIGICFIGSFSFNKPNAAALAAAKNLIACGVANHKISDNYKLLGHRQAKQTECPGESLFEEIKTWPKWIPKA